MLLLSSQISERREEIKLSKSFFSTITLSHSLLRRPQWLPIANKHIFLTFKIFYKPTPHPVSRLIFYNSPTVVVLSRASQSCTVPSLFFLIIVPCLLVWSSQPDYLLLKNRVMSYELLNALIAMKAGTNC